MKKKKLIVGLALACALALPLAFAACGDSGNSEGGNNNITDQVDATWKKAIEDFCAESGVANSDVMTEMQIFIAHYQSFTLADGKYTAAEIASVNGFVCKNIEIVMDGTKIVSVSYEFRTASKETPDRLITIDKDGVKKTDIPKPTDDEKMDEEEWNQQATVFANVTNYMLRRDSVETGELAGAMKLDGTTYYETTGLSEGIYETVGGKYYHYYRNAFSSEWVKEEVEASEYASSVQVPSLMVTVAAQAVQENFSSFEFDAGVYTADELTVEYAGMEFTLRDMEITVSGGKIVRAVCVLVDGYWGDGDERITVDHIGSTEIVYPTTFTDKTQSGGEETNEKMWDAEVAHVPSFTLDIAEGKTDIMTIYFDGENIGEVLTEAEAQGSTESHRWSYAIKEGDTYTTYWSDDNAKWFKESEKLSVDDIKNAISNYTMYVSALEGHFNDFSFLNGKYVCDSLTVTLNGQSVPLDSVEVVFVNDKLVSLTFKMFGFARLTYSEIGTTQPLTAPKDAVDAPSGGEGGEQGDKGKTEVNSVTWNEAFSGINNFSYQATVNGSMPSGEPFEFSMDGIFDGNKFETTTHDEAGDTHAIVVKENERYVQYSETDDGLWLRMDHDDMQEDLEMTFMTQNMLLPLFADQFDQFQYEEGQYVCAELTLAGTLRLVNVVVRFADGSLEFVSFTVRVEENTTEEFTFTDFGNVTVEVPEEYTDVPDQGSGTQEGETTAAVWDSEIERVSTNYTFEAPYGDTEMRYTLRDGDNIEQISKKNDNINNTWLRDIKEGEAYTEYTSSDGTEWIKRYFKATVEDVQVALDNFSDPLKGLKGHFNDFSFENGKYVCKELTLTVEGEETLFDWFEVVFDGDKIVSVTFQRFGSVQFTYSKLGETEVTAPAEYTEEKAVEGVDEFGNPKNKADDSNAA